MAKFPNVLDYGARPSLRSNRLDMPGDEAAILGDAVANAASAVVSLVDQKMDRDNKLQYALATDELTKADLAARESLKDRTDFENFDRDYSENYQTSADEIIGRHKLTATDRALLTAESNLAREQGRVFAGDLARAYRLDKVRTDVDQALLDGIEEIALADPPLQNKIMRTKRDLILGAVEQGAMSKEDGLKKIQAFTTEAATQSLDWMDPEQRLAELKMSEAHRNARGPITDEMIFNGEGSGSISDFLDPSALKKMIEQTEDEIEIENTQDIAQEATDSAWDLYKDPSQWKERQKHIKDFPGMTAKARKEANALNDVQRSRVYSGEGYERQATYQDMANDLFEAEATVGGDITLDPTKLATLLPAEQAGLRALQEQLREDKEWADDTQWVAYELWDNMSPQEKANWKSTDNFKIPVDPEDPNGEQMTLSWRQQVDADRAREMSDQRKIAKSQVATGRTYAGLNQTQLLHDTLVGLTTLFPDGKPTASSDADDQALWARISLAFNDALIEEGAYETISPTRRKAILTEVLSKEVKVTRTDFGIDKLDTDLTIQAVAYDPAERDDIYMELDVPQNMGGESVWPMTTAVKFHPDLGGNTMSPYKWIINQYAMVHPDNSDPDAKTIKHIWAIMATEGAFAAKARIDELAK